MINLKDAMQECVLNFLVFFLSENKNTAKTKFRETVEVILVYSSIALAISSTIYHQITYNIIVTSIANVSYAVYFLSIFLLFGAYNIPKLFRKRLA